jgi:hypothetical protein
VSTDDPLREAVVAALRDEFGEDDPGVLTDFIVVGAKQSYDQDGDPATSVFTLLGTQGPPLYRLVGLLDYALVRYRADIARDDD